MRWKGFYERSQGMGFFGGLIAVVIIFLVSFIFSAFASYFVNYGEKDSGSGVMIFTFIGFFALGIWLVFFV